MPPEGPIPSEKTSFLSDSANEIQNLTFCMFSLALRKIFQIQKAEPCAATCPVSPDASLLLSNTFLSGLSRRSIGFGKPPPRPTSVIHSDRKIEFWTRTVPYYYQVLLGQYFDIFIGSPDRDNEVRSRQKVIFADLQRKRTETSHVVSTPSSQR